MIVLDKIKEVEREFPQDGNKFLVFRGVSEECDIESSAARRLKNNHASNQMDFIKYHQVLVSDVKNGNYKGINDEDLKNLNELELLAQVQHLGGATCLTDFSTNFLIALWFASEENENKDGKVFIINLKAYKNAGMFMDIMDFIDKDKIVSIEDTYTYKSDNDTKKTTIEDTRTYKYDPNTKKVSIEDILTYKCDPNTKKEHFWYWKPRKTNGRFNNQNSIFIFGLPEVPKDVYEKIPIYAHEKSQIRQELKDYFGINEETIYPDLQGFSLYANNHKAKFYDFFNLSCADIVLNYSEDKKYFDCLRYIEKMRECNKGNSRENCLRVAQNITCKDKSKDNINFLEGLCKLKQTSDDYNKIKNQSDNGPYYYKKLINSQLIAYARLKMSLKGNDSKYIYESMYYILECLYEMVLYNPEYLKIHKKIFNDVIGLRQKYLELITSQTNERYRDSSEDYTIDFSLLELSIFAESYEGFRKMVTIIKKKNRDERCFKNCIQLLYFFVIIGAFVVFRDKFYSTFYSKFYSEPYPESYSESFSIPNVFKLIRAIENRADEIYDRSKNKEIFTFAANWNISDMKSWLNNFLEKKLISIDKQPQDKPLDNNSLDKQPLFFICDEIKRLQGECKYKQFEAKLPNTKD